MGNEHTPFFARKIGRYLDLHRSGSWRSRLPLWPLVLVVTESDARATQLRRVTEAMLSSQPDRQWLARATAFDFTSAGDLVGPAGPLGEIWQVAGRPGRAGLTPERIAVQSSLSEIAAGPSRSAREDPAGGPGRPAMAGDPIGA